MRSDPAAAPVMPAAPVDGASCRDRLRFYASVARWAPSKHNSQPWRFVVSEDALEVWPDPGRVLPRTDPHQRELVLSCGAVVHLAEVAARGVGRQLDVAGLPEGRGGPVARLTEVGPWPTSPRDLELLAAVPRRRTDRGPLDTAALPASLPFDLQDAADREGATLRLVSTPGDRATLARLVEQADRLLVRSGQVDEELARWRQVAGDGRSDGVPVTSTRGPRASASAELVQRDFSAVGAVPAHDRPGPDRPLLGVLCTAHDTPQDWLAAGRALASVLLTATVAGAQASYVDQAVEQEDMRVLLGEQLGLPGPPQLCLRVGTGGPVDAPPRRPLDEVLYG